MTLIVEFGSGAREANAYVAAAFVTTYLTNLGRETENSWSSIGSGPQEDAIIAATQYIDTRWGPRFKGQRSRYYDGRSAQGRIAFSGLPLVSTVYTIGVKTYTLVAALTDDLTDGEVLFDATTAAELVADLVAAIVTSGTEGVNYSKLLTPNEDAFGQINDDDTAFLDLFSYLPGIGGNDIPISASDPTNSTITAMAHGLDNNQQALEFPRANLFSRAGTRISGVPLKVKQACAEYAVRAAGATLYSDPTVDATGRVVTSKAETVGPIKTDTKYEEGSSLTNLLKPYPAADRLLTDFLLPAGRAFR